MIDSDLLRHVSDGLKLLVMADGTIKERLTAAFQEFSVALLQPDGWPDHLLERAQKLDNELTANRTYGAAIAAMSESAARDMAERVCDLAVDVEVAVRIDMRDRN